MSCGDRTVYSHCWLLDLRAVCGLRRERTCRTCPAHGAGGTALVGVEVCPGGARLTLDLWAPRRRIEACSLAAAHVPGSAPHLEGGARARRCCLLRALSMRISDPVVFVHLQLAAGYAPALTALGQLRPLAVGLALDAPPAGISRVARYDGGSAVCAFVLHCEAYAHVRLARQRARARNLAAHGVGSVGTSLRGAVSGRISEPLLLLPRLTGCS